MYLCLICHVTIVRLVGPIFFFILVQVSRTSVFLKTNFNDITHDSHIIFPFIYIQNSIFLLYFFLIAMYKNNSVLNIIRLAIL